MTQICDFPNCGKDSRSRSKYCSDECRRSSARLNHELKKANEPLDLDEKVERERIRLRNREEMKQLAQLHRTEAKRQEYLDVLRETVSVFEPSPFIDPVKATKDAASISWSIDLSDWQVGQFTPIQSTGGIYEQTTEIAAKQLDRIWTSLKSIWDIEVGSGHKTLSRIWLNFIGDLIDGDCLRPAQAAQIDRVVTRQVLEVSDLAGLLIRRVLTLPGIKYVDIDMVGGNHDRTSTKAGNGGLGELDFVDTYAWLIGHWLKQSFSEDKRVRITVWDTFYGYRKFGGMKHAFEHGASFRGSAGSYGGIPWYPISNAAQQYIKMLGGVDMVHMGHFHQPAILPLGQAGWTVMNGALPVSSQFIQSSFKGLRAPLQWLIEYNLRKEWVNGWYPLYADVGQFKQAGQVWDEVQGSTDD